MHVKQKQDESWEEPSEPKKTNVSLVLGLFLMTVVVTGACCIYAFNAGYQMAYDAGYIIGVKDGAGTGYDIRDPTYREVLQFIASDQTDKNQYNDTSYNCVHYTRDVKSNAFDLGYRCGSVYIEFPDSGHIIVAFYTTDKAVIFIEPQTDQTVSLVIGQPYWDRTKYVISYDDTIVSYTIMW